MDTNGHYTVEYGKVSGVVQALSCCHCEFFVWRHSVSQPRTSKSGLGRYNRMRGRMVKHLHGSHRSRLERCIL